MLTLLLSCFLPFGPLAEGTTVRAEELEAPSAVAASATRLTIQPNPGQETATLIIRKERAEGNAPLAGAEYTLRDNNSDAAWAVDTDSDGRAAFKNLPVGNYSLKETRAPEGYSADPVLYTIDVEVIHQDVIADIFGTVQHDDGTEETVKLTRTLAVHLDTSALTGEHAAEDSLKLHDNLDITLGLLFADAVDYIDFNDIPRHFAANDTLFFSGIPASALKAQLSLDWDDNAPPEENIGKGFQFEVLEADVPEEAADHTFLVRVTALENTEAPNETDYTFNILSFIVGPEKDEDEVPTFEERFADLEPEIIDAYALLDRDGLTAEISRVQKERDQARERLDILRSEEQTEYRLTLAQRIVELPDEIAELKTKRQEILNHEDAGGGGIDVVVGDVVDDDTDIIIVNGDPEPEEQDSPPETDESKAPDIIIDQGETSESEAEPQTETEALPQSENPDIQQLDETIQKLQSELEELTQELDTLEREIEDTLKEHAHCVLQLDLLRYHVERLTEERIAKEREAREAKEERTIDIPLEIEDLPVADPADTVEDVEAKLTQAEAEKVKTLEDIKESKEAIDQLLDELEAVDQELEAMTEELAELLQGSTNGGGGEDIDLTVDPKEDNKQSLVDSDKQIEIQRIETKIQSLKDKRQDLLIKISESGADIAAYEAKIHAFDSIIGELRAYYLYMKRPDTIIARSEAIDIGDGSTALAATVGTPAPAEKIEIFVDKKWEPDPNDDMIPEAFYLLLSRKDTSGNLDDFGSIPIYKKGDTWYQSIGTYNRYVDGDPDKGEWIYEVDEKPINGYRLSNVDSKEETATDGTTLTFTLTNTREDAEDQPPGTVDLILRKVWDMGGQSSIDLPAEVKFTVKQTASTGVTRELGPYILTANDAVPDSEYIWEIKIQDIKDRDDEGTAYTYEVTEDVPAGYDAVVEKTVKDNGDQLFTVTNIKKKKTGQREIEVVLQKIWQLVKSNTKLTGKITFTLKRKDKDGKTEDVGDFSLSEADGDKTGTVRVWTKSLGSFDYWKDSSDHAKGNYTYFVEEKSIAGFKGTVGEPVWNEANGKLTLKVTNTQDGYKPSDEPSPTTTDEDGKVTTTIPGTGEERALWIPLILALLATVILFFRRHRY